MNSEAQRPEANSSVVATSAGLLQGVAGNHVEIFRGVPYAKPPLGALRFCAPEKADPWDGVRPATDWAPSAVQEARPDFEPLRWYRSSQPTSEDCLYLNVFTPSADNAKRPVMVWFHGGAFSTGAGTSTGFEGSVLAARGDVVVVTVNHRLNIFGFFHPGPEADETFADSTNAGLLDLVAALEWVRDNIANFGGDPDCVTIFGESGGGGKVGRLLGMPAAQGLYHRAILQSSGLRSTTAKLATESAAHLLAQFDLTIKDAAKLREVPADKLLAARLTTTAAMGVDAFEPLADGRALPEMTFQTGAPDMSATIPIMIGTCKDEVYYLLADIPGIYDITRSEALERLVNTASMTLEKAAQLYDLYAKENPGEPPVQVYVALLTDLRFRMNTIRAATFKSEQGKAPAYLYRFNWPSPARNGKLRALHTIEVPFVFGTMRAAETLVGTGPEVDSICDMVMGAWVAFARTGDPNHSGIPEWRPYSSAERGTMMFNAISEFVSDPPGDALLALREHSMPPGFSRKV